MESYLRALATQDGLNEDARAPWKCRNSKSTPVEDFENNNSGGFDCNICLDSVHDPVVTFCGHLYCWPCIYKWIHCQSISSEKTGHREPECPVCKAEISEKTLIPLYGPGLSTNSSVGMKAPDVGLVIPQRPKTPRCAASTQIASTRTSSNSHPAQQLHHRSYPQSDQYYHPYPGGYMASPMLSVGGAGTNLSQPLFGMFGEMMYARISGNPQLYTYPNSYHLAGGTSQRMRRRIMAVDKSLNRICFFLFCCMVLCLLLF